MAVFDVLGIPAEPPMTTDRKLKCRTEDSYENSGRGLPKTHR